MKNNRRRDCLRALALCPVIGWKVAVAANTAATVTPKPIRHTVRIVGAQFIPSKLSIKAGDSVRFINEDIVPHTATGTRHEKDWDTATLKHSEDRRISFDTPGEYPYFCRFHPSMVAHISVITPS